ncbi:F-box protein CPR30 [Forsythia ovata]|uniref:F-box protein CPR30 n=1 Tax=Forsythia ovata TaxID=205694 RepID=A0ABD1WQ10_9LAMI
MSALTEDLVVDVLSRLPVVTLLRFRCVSKSWQALIDSSYFIKLHLNKSLKDIKSHKIIAIGRYYNENNVDHSDFIFYAINFDFGFGVAEVKEIKPPVQEFSDSVSFIGSCRFLICLRYSDENILLWNPSIRKHRIIPYTRVEIEDLLGRKYTQYRFGFGFGYDNVMDDHKVVRLVFDRHSGDYEVQVYSLKLDTWKKIEKFPICIYWVSKPNFVNGSMNWLVLERKPNPTFSLLVLCLRTEVCRLVSLPEWFNEYRPINWDYCFNCLDWTPWVVGHCSTPCHALWKIMDYENSDFWTKLRLPHSDSDEGMVSSEIYQHLNWIIAKDSLQEILCSESIEICCWGTCCWVDSLFQLKKCNHASKIRELVM